MSLTSATVDIQAPYYPPFHTWEAWADEHHIRKQAAGHGLIVTRCHYTGWNGVFEVTVAGDEFDIKEYLSDVGWGENEGYQWIPNHRGLTYMKGVQLYPLREVS